VVGLVEAHELTAAEVEDRIVAAPRGRDLFERLGPHGIMPPQVLVEHLGLHPQSKSDARHRTPPSCRLQKLESFHYAHTTGLGASPVSKLPVSWSAGAVP